MNKSHTQNTTHKKKYEHAYGFHGIEGDARALKIAGWLTGIYFIIELGLGLYSGSLVVISDAFHTFSAVGGVLIALVANRIATHAASSTYTFGRLRMEIGGALLNGMFLLLMALFILWMGFSRLQKDIDLPTNIMLISAIGGLITEFISIGVMWKKLKGNLNMQGAFWHIIQTFVGSIIIIIAALVIKFTGWYPIDPILGMLFGLVLLWASWGIIRDSFNILLEAAPEDVDVEKVLSDLQKIEGVKDIHHIHAWTLTSGKNLFMAHVMIADSASYETVLDKSYKLLKEKYDFYFTTLQVEKKCKSLHEAEFIDYIERQKE